MKKSMVLVVLLCLLAVWGATAGIVSPPSSSGSVSKTVASVTTTSLITLGKTYLQSHDILKARDQFKLAVDQDATNQEASLLYGVTRVFAIFEQGQYANSAGLDSVRKIMELSGFSFQSFGLYDTQLDHPKDLPATTPRTGAVLDFVKTNVLPEIAGAIANLGVVTNPSFSSSIAPADINKYSGQNIYIDYADALVIKSLLNVVQCNLNLLMVYGLDVSLPDISAAPDQLLTYKQLLADGTVLNIQDAASLGTARTALTNFIDTYQSALTQLSYRRGVAHHLFVVDASALVTDEPVNASFQGLSDISNVLTDIRSSLDGPTLFSGDGAVQDRTVDLSKFFDAGAPIDIRNSLVSCSSGAVLPDPTIKGLFPLGFSNYQKFVAGSGSYLLAAFCPNSDTPMFKVGTNWLSFWNPTAGAAQTQFVTIGNRGTAPLHVTSAILTGTNAAAFTLDKGSCSSVTPTLQAGTSCNLGVTLGTTDYGSFSATLLINSDDLSNPRSTVGIYGYRQAPPGGIISGVMKDAVTGLGVQGYVYLYDISQGYNVAGISTDFSGAFSLSGLTVGSYKVNYSPWDGTHVSQWYNGMPTMSSATPVVLGTANLTLSPAFLVRGGSLSGFVKDSATGTGITGLSVTLCDSLTSEPVTMTSTYNGYYSFSQVAPGSYKVQIGSGSGYASQWYNAGAAVTVTAFLNTALSDVSMTMAGSISGKVKDAATLAGIPGIYVSLYDSLTNVYLAQAPTDSTGAYTVTGLPSGSYKVNFSSGGGYYQNSYYHDANSLATATPVSVTAPAETTGINASLQPFGKISGTVTDQSGARVSGVSVSATTSGGSTTWGATTNSTGDYTIAGLPTGSYQVRFSGNSQGLVNEYYSKKTYSDEAALVQVSALHTTGGINAQLGSGGSIAGRVTDGSGAPISGLTVTIYDVYDYSRSSASTDASGNYQAKGLPAGSYRVSFNGYVKGFVTSFYGGTSQISLAALVPVSATGTTSGINASLAPGGSISGTIVDAAGMPVSGTSVSVYDPDGSIISSASSDVDGKYTALGVPAGTFKVAFTTGARFAGQWYGGKGSFSSATSILVASVTATTGINAQLGAGASIMYLRGIKDFGAVATNSTDSFRIFSIYNYGSAPLVLGAGAVSLSGTDAAQFALQKDYCSGQTLAAGGVCTFRASFAPVSLGAKNAFVTIASNDADTPLLTIAVKGTGVVSQPSSSATTLASSVNPSLSGQSLSFSATVTAFGSGLGTPGGTVTFKDGATVLGTGTLNGSGLATFATSALSAGSHSISALYGGNGSFNPSGSAVLTQTVNPALWNISVLTAGSGSGSVISALPDSGISCYSSSSLNCSANFANGKTITLTPTALSNSVFAGWSGPGAGGCSGTLGACLVTMNAAKSITASFTANPALVRISSAPGIFYYLLGKTLDLVALQKTTVLAQDDIFVENVVLSNPLEIILKGGYTDSAFSTQSASSFSIIDGSLKIQKGRLDVERLKIR
jgi:hypothetical protein